MDNGRLGQRSFAEVDRLLDEAVSSGTIPGASYCVRSSTSVHWTYSTGSAELRPKPRVATDSTAWDLASLTKVLATTPIAMALVDAGILSVGDHVRRWLPECEPDIKIAHLLSHSSGMPAWEPLTSALPESIPGTPEAREAALAFARKMSPLAAAGERYAYSDIGFLMLCDVLERASGERLDVLFERFVRQPSGVDLRWGWPDAAATEDCPRRGRVVVGEVHDLNAWLMGGVSSHAGLFGTAQAVAALGAWQLRAFLGETGEGLAPGVVRSFIQTPGAGSHRLGWDGVSPGGSAGPLWPDDGFGHLAFTGCSLWVAPRQDCIVALCTNRIHPIVEGGAKPGAPPHPRYRAFKQLRIDVHTAIVTALKRYSAWPR